MDPRATTTLCLRSWPPPASSLQDCAKDLAGSPRRLHRYMHLLGYKHEEPVTK
jgi:hypothetical protein